MKAINIFPNIYIHTYDFDSDGAHTAVLQLNGTYCQHSTANGWYKYNVFAFFGKWSNMRAARDFRSHSQNAFLRPILCCSLCFVFLLCVFHIRIRCICWHFYCWPIEWYWYFEPRNNDQCNSMNVFLYFASFKFDVVLSSLCGRSPFSKSLGTRFSSSFDINFYTPSRV